MSDDDTNGSEGVGPESTDPPEPGPGSWQSRYANGRIGGDTARRRLGDVGPPPSPPSTRFRRAVEDADRAADRYRAALRLGDAEEDRRPAVPTVPATPRSAQLEAGRAVEQAASARERQAALLEVIATSATASKEAMVDVHAAIVHIAADSETTQAEALRIARTSQRATVIGVWVSSLSAVIAVIAIVVTVVLA